MPSSPPQSKHRRLTLRRVVLALVVGLAAWWGVSWWYLIAHRSRITLTNFDQVQLGMKPDEVFSILGVPTGDISAPLESMLPRPPLMMSWVGGNKIYGYYTWTRSGDVCIAVQTRLTGGKETVIHKRYYAFDYLAWKWKQH